MAVISVTIADTDLPRVVNGVSAYFNYQPLLPDITGLLTIPNPETKNQFARRMLVTSVKGWVKASESITAAENARVTANQAADLLGIS